MGARAAVGQLARARSCGAAPAPLRKPAPRPAPTPRRCASFWRRNSSLSSPPTSANSGRFGAGRATGLRRAAAAASRCRSGARKGAWRSGSSSNTPESDSAPFTRSAGRPGVDAGPVGGEHHRREMAAGRMPGDDDPRRVAAMRGGVAPDPGQRRPLLAHDLVDARRRAERVVRHDHQGAGGDEGRGDERGVALVERAPVAAVDVDQHRRARRGGREQVEPLCRGRCRRRCRASPAARRGPRPIGRPTPARICRCSGMRARLLYCASNHSGAAARGAPRRRTAGARSCASPSGVGHRRPSRPGRRTRLRRRGRAASRCAASIRASAIHSAMRSTSRSGRPQMSFRIM